MARVYGSYAEMYGPRADAERKKRSFARRKLTVEQRFWALVEVTENCWLFSSTGTDARKAFYPGPGKSVSAPKFALELKLGRPLLPGHCAGQTCDVPACVRFDHLVEITFSDRAKRAQRTRKANGTDRGWRWKKLLKKRNDRLALFDQKPTGVRKDVLELDSPQH